MRPLLLASKSPRRRMLLGWLKIPVRIISPRASIEASFSEGSPEKIVKRLALAKARTVSRRYPRHWVLGADTVVAVGRRILGKPARPAEARAHLKLLSRRTHQVLTGVVLLAPGGAIQAVHIERTSVAFRKLSAREVEEYLRTREPYDKAGGYAIQGTAAAWVRELRGDYFNVVGLPLDWLAGCLGGLSGTRFSVMPSKPGA